jgi:hypothetical protein
MALGFTQHLTEMSTRNFPGGSSAQPACKFDNITAICEPISKKYKSLDISQPYKYPRSVAGIAFLCFLLTYNLYLQFTTALSLIQTVILQNILHIFSLLCLHQSLSGNDF